MATIAASAYNLIPKNLIGIYSILNTQNGKRYIGQSVDIKKRIYAHFRPNRRSKTAIGRAVLKYGEESFKIEILKLCEKDSLNRLEIFYVNKFNSLSPKGYNLVHGGSSRQSISDETRSRMSKSHIGHVRTRESIEKQRQKTIGIKRSAETLEKMSAWQIGVPKTKEFVEKMKKALKGRKAPNKGKKMLDEQKEKIRLSKAGKPATWRWVSVIRNDGMVFKSIDEAANYTKAHRITILKHLAGKLKTVRGYTFIRGGVPSQP